jgi:hypothetical protein
MRNLEYEKRFWRQIFGDVYFERGLYKFKVKILHDTNSNNLWKTCIGICSTPNLINLTNFYTWFGRQCNAYAIITGNGTFISGTIKDSTKEDYRYNHKENKIITPKENIFDMMINIQNNITIKVNINNKQIETYTINEYDKKTYFPDGKIWPIFASFGEKHIIEIVQ